jgi:hypothetical protein
LAKKEKQRRKIRRKCFLRKKLSIACQSGDCVFTLHHTQAYLLSQKKTPIKVSNSQNAFVGKQKTDFKS